VLHKKEVLSRQAIESRNIILKKRCSFYVIAVISQGQII